MNKLAWAGIAYGVHLGVINWHKLQELEDTVNATNKMLVALVGEAGKLSK